MESSMLELYVGYSSAALVSILNAPQAVKVYRMRSAQGLSALSLGLHLSNSMLWLFYGVILQKMPIICANGFYLLTNMTLIAFKIQFRHEELKI